MTPNPKSSLLEAIIVLLASLGDPVFVDVRATMGHLGHVWRTLSNEWRILAAPETCALFADIEPSAVLKHVHGVQYTSNISKLSQ